MEGKGYLCCLEVWLWISWDLYPDEAVSLDPGLDSLDPDLGLSEPSRGDVVGESAKKNINWYFVTTLVMGEF